MIFTNYPDYLKWLLYIVAVISLFTFGLWTGIPQLMFALDASYLSYMITGFYLVVEAQLGYMVIKYTRKQIVDRDLVITDDETRNYHFKTLMKDEVLKKAEFAKDAGDIILMIGLLGTIVGIIMAFMPFMAMVGFDINVIQPQFVTFLKGAAIAFIPTALSLLYKILLDINYVFILEPVVEKYGNEIMSLANTNGIFLT